MASKSVDNEKKRSWARKKKPEKAERVSYQDRLKNAIQASRGNGEFTPEHKALLLKAAGTHQEAGEACLAHNDLMDRLPKDLQAKITRDFYRNNPDAWERYKEANKLSPEQAKRHMAAFNAEAEKFGKNDKQKPATDVAQQPKNSVQKAEDTIAHKARKDLERQMAELRAQAPELRQAAVSSDIYQKALRVSRELRAIRQEEIKNMGDAERLDWLVEMKEEAALRLECGEKANRSPRDRLLMTPDQRKVQAYMRLQEIQAAKRAAKMAAKHGLTVALPAEKTAPHVAAGVAVVLASAASQAELKQEIESPAGASSGSHGKGSKPSERDMSPEEQARQEAAAHKRAIEGAELAGRSGVHYYAVLGVDEKASLDEIRQAYVRKVKEYHPAANPDNPEAAAMFMDATSAYEILRDEERRDVYDRARAQFHAAHPAAPIEPTVVSTSIHPSQGPAMRPVSPQMREQVKEQAKAETEAEAEEKKRKQKEQEELQKTKDILNEPADKYASVRGDIRLGDLILMKLIGEERFYEMRLGIVNALFGKKGGEPETSNAPTSQLDPQVEEGLARIREVKERQHDVQKQQNLVVATAFAQNNDPTVAGRPATGPQATGAMVMVTQVSGTGANRRVDTKAAFIVNNGSVTTVGIVAASNGPGQPTIAAQQAGPQPASAPSAPSPPRGM